MSQHRIERIETAIIDLPLVRTQRFAAIGAETTAVVLIRVFSKDGAQGIGECCTPSGPWWGGESVESIKLHIDRYITPELIGDDPFDLRGMSKRLDRVLFGNAFAKAGVEMALLDLQGKILGCPVYDLLGGRQRSELVCSWPLATGEASSEIDEAERRIENGQFNRFKLKMGFLSLEDDVDRACSVARGLEGRALVRADPNESWSETDTMWALPRLADAGIDVVEQPISRRNFDGMARITARSRVPVMADESVCSEDDVVRLGQTRAADIISLKVMKSFGLTRARRIADIANTMGVSLYMGTFLECSLGTAANMQLAATLEDLPYGGELSGPCLVAEDILQKPARYENFALQLEKGHGIAADLDEDKVKRFTRDGAPSQHVVKALEAVSDE